MTKIIFDASVLVTGHVRGKEHKTGLYRVSYEILSGLLKLGLFEIYLFDVFYRERELEKYRLSHFPKCSIIRVYSHLYRWFIFPVCYLADSLRLIENKSDVKAYRKIAKVFKNIFLCIDKIARKIERYFLKNKLRSSTINFSLYYSTYFPIPEEIRKNIDLKIVYTVHDVIPLIHSEYFSSSFNALLIKEVVENIKNDDYVICVSESTKKDLLALKPDLNPLRIFVAPLAAAKCFHPITDQVQLKAIREKYKIQDGKKYLLSVCTFEPRKNLKTLIAAYRILLEEGKADDLYLVLAGAPYWEKDILLDEIAFLNNTYNNQVIITGFVPDEDLAVIYSGAYTFIYPSFYEGFGLPPLEAMQCGIPVICSNTSSLPEVIGDCGILFDPESETELVSAIDSLLKDKGLRNILSQRSFTRAANFDWENTTSIINNVFEQAIFNK